MSQDFDQFPVYDPLVDKVTYKMSDIWISVMSAFYMNLIGYLTQGGILLPVLTTAQRDALFNLQNGQMIYNSTTKSFQGYENGLWKTFTLT